MMPDKDNPLPQVATLPVSVVPTSSERDDAISNSDDTEEAYNRRLGSITNPRIAMRSAGNTAPGQINVHHLPSGLENGFEQRVPVNERPVSILPDSVVQGQDQFHTDLMDVRLDLAVARAELHRIESQLYEAIHSPQVETVIANQVSLLKIASEIRENIAVLLRAVAQIEEYREQCPAFLVLQKKHVKEVALDTRGQAIIEAEADIADRLHDIEAAEADLSRRQQTMGEAEARLMKHAKLILSSYDPAVQKSKERVDDDAEHSS
ncbi:hypothetical protein EDC01DRAFT_630712 [Geopyxis carbonaria]|nr:hypothetical protein EDC01DRAFT_630712 [Geopyxis carbonaria]